MKKPPPALEIETIGARYGSKTILENFSLTVEAEEIVSLLGPSGCGKTTLLKCIAGFEDITAGSIRIFGSTIQTPEKSLPTQKRGLGMVFQDNALFPHLTVHQNVVFGLSRAEQKNPTTQEWIQKLLLTLRLLPLADKYPHEISGGQQQRTSLARSIAPRPRLLLMDEPFTGQDVELKEQIIESVIRLLQKERITTLVVTHDQNEAFKISHRVGVIKEFRLEQIGAPKDIYHSPATRFTAGFIGTGAFMEAVYSQNQARNDWFTFQEKESSLSRFRGDQKVWVHLRPEDVILSGTRSQKGVEGVILRKEFRSGNYLYRVCLVDTAFPDEYDPVLYSLMPTNFEKNIGDRVTVHPINKSYTFFPIPSDS